MEFIKNSLSGQGRSLLRALAESAESTNCCYDAVTKKPARGRLRRKALIVLVERRRIELPTFALRTRRSPS